MFTSVSKMSKTEMKYWNDHCYCKKRWDRDSKLSWIRCNNKNNKCLMNTYQTTFEDAKHLSEKKTNFLDDFAWTSLIHLMICIENRIIFSKVWLVWNIVQREVKRLETCLQLLLYKSKFTTQGCIYNMNRRFKIIASVQTLIIWQHAIAHEWACRSLPLKVFRHR